MPALGASGLAAAASVDSGATAWVLAASALVLLMTPGVAFFYGGMVRSQHALSILFQNLMVMAIVSLTWVVVAFSLAFGGGSGWIGDLRLAGLGHLDRTLPGFDGAHALAVPPIVFAIFQLMFAIITPALITGATADRWRLRSFVLFVPAWVLLVYAPVAHWVFSPVGVLARWGVLDFAGGTVVHTSSGAAGLAMAIVLGRRRGWPTAPMRPHSLPLVVLGTALLWFGWFGFNAGSSLRADEVAGYAFINTNTSAAAALLAWTAVERLRFGRPTTLGAASGVVAGLVAITPCAGYVTPLGAIAIGLIAGVACAVAVSAKVWFGVDDALDVVGVHLVGGVLGTICVGLFATTAVNSAGADGLFFGGGYGLLGRQTAAALLVGVWSFAVTWAIGRVLDRFVGNRVSPEVEDEGLDLTLHGETAYEDERAAGDVRV